MGVKSKLILTIVGAAALSGCNSVSTTTYVPGAYSMMVDESALARSYLNLQNFSSFEVAAETIRNSASFVVQNFVSTYFGMEHFSLDAANVEYAHSVNLSGAGQIISVVDEGFLVDHDAISGKSITTMESVHSGSPTDPCTSDPELACEGAHGTAVAAIAAGSFTGGYMVGVAPDADLQLGLYYDYYDMADLTNQAASIGAIVQNNSWGFPSTYGSQSNFNAMLRVPGAVQYVEALRDFAQNGVVVFAASNDYYAPSYDLAAAFPDFVPGLEGSFIAAINVIPSMDSSGNIVDATRVSAGCLEAARYCMAADGTIISASVDPNDLGARDAYAEWTGTSFAAPQISGAVAILAEAFPDLSAQELRARLLASADNSFFAHTGYVEFSETVRHGFNEEFGHGFLDLASALLPIGSAYMPTANGAAPIPVDRPSVTSFGPTGNAISAGLQDYEIVFGDELGGDFTTNAQVISGYGLPQSSALDYLQTQIMTDARQVASLGSAFADHLGGQEYSVSAGADLVSLLLPVENSGASLGINWQTQSDTGVAFGLSAAYDAASVAGVSSFGGLGASQSLSAAASFEITEQISPGLEFGFGARFGVALPMAADNDLMSIGASAYDEFGLRFASNNIGVNGDRLQFRLAAPQAVTSGNVAFALPVAMAADGSPEFRAVDVSMAPSARQYDISLDYTRPLASGAEIVFSASHSVNFGNVAGHSDTSAGLGWRIAF